MIFLRAEGKITCPGGGKVTAGSEKWEFLEMFVNVLL